MRSQLALATALVFIAVAATLATPARTTARSLVGNDPELVTALQHDPELVRRCDCITGARWLDESYPRITVRAAAYRGLDRSARARFDARALHVAEATYLAENAAVDQYEEVYIVDERGRTLSSGHR